MPTPFPIAGTSAPLVTPVSLTSQWVTALTAGTVATQDGSSGVITDPDALSEDTHIRLTRHNQAGSLIMARLVYDGGVTGVTDPELVLFGRTTIEGVSDEWQLLPTVEDTPALSSTLVTSASDDGAADVTDGTMLYSTPDRKSNVWDSMGCNEFVFGVKTAFDATGTKTNAVVQAKII